MPSCCSRPMKAMSSGIGVFGPDVERSLRAGRVVAHGLQRVAEQVAFRLVVRHVHGGFRYGADYPLPDRGGVDVPQNAVGHGARAAQFGDSGKVRRKRQVPDAFARDRHGFRPAPGDHGAVEDAHRFRSDRSIERERPVRLVADHQDRVRENPVDSRAARPRYRSTPVGLLGELRIRARVRGVRAAGDARRVGLETARRFPPVTMRPPWFSM